MKFLVLILTLSIPSLVFSEESNYSCQALMIPESPVVLKSKVVYSSFLESHLNQTDSWLSEKSSKHQVYLETLKREIHERMELLSKELEPTNPIFELSTQLMRQLNKDLKENQISYKDLMDISYKAVLIYGTLTKAEKKIETKNYFGNGFKEDIQNWKMGRLKSDIFKNNSLAFPILMTKRASFETSNILMGYGAIPLMLSSGFKTIHNLKNTSPYVDFIHDLSHYKLITSAREREFQYLQTTGQESNKKQFLLDSLAMNQKILLFINNSKHSPEQQRGMHYVWWHLTHELNISLHPKILKYQIKDFKVFTSDKLNLDPGIKDVKAEIIKEYKGDSTLSEAYKNLNIEASYETLVKFIIEN